MGLLAGLDAFLVALVLLAAMFAVSAVLRPLLVNVLSQAPFVGGWLAQHVDEGLASFQRAITAPANASMSIVSSSLDWVANQGRQALQSLKDMAGAAYWTSWVILTVSIPDAVGKGLQQAEALISQARADALGLFQQAEDDIKTSLLRAETIAATAVSVARSDLESEISAAESVVLLEIRKAEQNAGALFLQASSDLQAGLNFAESQAADLVSRAREDLGAAVGAVEHDLQKLAEAERVALTDSVSVLGGDIKAAEDRASQALSAAEEGLQGTIDSVIKSGPWGALVALYTGGEAALKADVETVVRLSLQELRQQIREVGVLRSKYAPQVRAELDKLVKA